jgi:serine/threonine protein kinase
VSRYVVVDVLGAGAMGVVYAARDVELGRMVALKLLRDEMDHGRARLLREAKAAASLSHPNVVVVYEVGTFKGRAYLAMEHVEGVTLAQWLGTRREPHEIVAVFRQAGEGLAAAHEAGIVHRDFKPDNVLVGRDGRAKIADFGIASTSAEALAQPARWEAFESGPVLCSLTPTGAAVGTPAYMAPELFDGPCAADHLSDQFAFAVSLYEGLYGRRPFSIHGGVQAGVSFPALHGTRHLSPILRRALSRDPASRFPDLRALLRAIDGAVAREAAPRAGGWATFAAAFLPLVVAVAAASGSPGEAGSTRSTRAALTTTAALPPELPADNDPPAARPMPNGNEAPHARN